MVRRVLLIFACVAFSCRTPGREGPPPKPTLAALPDGCIDGPAEVVGMGRAPGGRDEAAARAAIDEAEAALTKDDAEGALVALARAVAADGTLAVAQEKKAALHLRRRELAAAQEHGARAIILAPRVASAHRTFADASALIGNDETAKVHYECALAVDDAIPGVHGPLAAFYLSAGDGPRAETSARAALSSAPDDRALRMRLAEALAMQERHEEAAKEVLAVADVIGKSAPLFRRAATHFRAAGLDEAADAALAKADELEPAPETRKLRPLPPVRPPPPGWTGTPPPKRRRK